jgi:hypothetical protein
VVCKNSETYLKRNVTNLEQEMIKDGQVSEGVLNFENLGIVVK